jgi:hypothetical protein
MAIRILRRRIAARRKGAIIRHSVRRRDRPLAAAPTMERRRMAEGAAMLRHAGQILHRLRRSNRVRARRRRLPRAAFKARDKTPATNRQIGESADARLRKALRRHEDGATRPSLQRTHATKRLHSSARHGH